MLRVVFFLSSLLCVIDVDAQADLIHLNVKQTIYFEGDVLNGGISYTSNSSGEISAQVKLVNSLGEVIDNFFLILESNSTKKIQIPLPDNAASGWYFLQIEKAEINLLSNVVRILVLENSVKVGDLFSFQNSESFYVLPEGDNKIIHGVLNTFFVKFDQHFEKGFPEIVELKTNTGRVLQAVTVDANGFAMFEFAPNSLTNYTIHVSYSDHTFDSKQIDQNIFSKSGAVMHINFLREEVISVKLDARQIALEGSSIRVLHKGTTLLNRSIQGSDEFKLDISPYPKGLLRFVLTDKEKNVLNERIIFNKGTNSYSQKELIVESPSSIKRGESVTFEINFDHLDIEVFDNDQLIVNVIDETQSLYQNSKNETITASADFDNLQYLFPELTKMNREGQTSKQLDNYFATNRSITPLSAVIDLPQNSTSNNKITVQGKLLKRTGEGIPYTPMVLTIPSIEGSLQYVMTDKLGSFSFSNLSFSGNHEIHLAPLLSEDLEKYEIKILNETANYKPINSKSFYSGKDWKSLLHSAILKNNIKNVYGNSVVEKDTLLPVNNEKSLKSIFKSVDHDMNLNDYVILENMTKFINEVVPGINIRKNSFRAFSKELKRTMEGTPLIFLDGVLFSDQETLLQQDPIRFERIQVITSISKMQSLGIGGSGMIAFYTRDGYNIENSTSHVVKIEGFHENSTTNDLRESSNISHPEGSESGTSDRRTPHLPDNFIFSINKNPNDLANMNFSFLAPDIVTKLCVNVDLVRGNEVITISKLIQVEK